MLVLSRKTGERIMIGDRITVVVNRIAGGRVTLAIEAPNTVRILRGELTPYPDSFSDPNPGESEAVVTIGHRETARTNPATPQRRTPR